MGEMRLRIKMKDTQLLLEKGWDDVWIERYLDKGGKSEANANGWTADMWKKHTEAQDDYDAGDATEVAKHSAKESLRESIERMNREAAANLIQRQQAAAVQQMGMAAGMNPMMMGQMANMANNPYMQG